MKVYEAKIDHGFEIVEETLAFVLDKYATNDSTALVAYCKDGSYWEMYDTVSVNLGWPPEALGENEFFFDTNNSSRLFKWMLDEGLIEKTGVVGASGYCTYPLVTPTKKLLEGIATYDELI